MLMFDGLEVDAYGGTHVGKVRPTNEDQFVVAALHKAIQVLQTSIPHQYQDRFESGARALLLLVADGVGGSAAGEEASSATLDAIMSYTANSMRCYFKLDEQVSQDLLAELALSVQQSHAAVRSQAERDPEHAGMATTLTMAHVLWPRAYVVQIGDSRCYHIRGPAITQITRDQTLVQYLVDEGALSPEAAARSPLSNVLSQAIGGRGSEITPEISKVELESRDVLLLCTDGLTKHVPDDAIAEQVRYAESAQTACEGVIAAALDAGGTDNVTVVVSRFG